MNQAGLDVARYRLPPLVRRLRACLRAMKVADLDAAWRRLDTEPASIGLALEALLIGVTEFFRDDEVFAEMSGQVLPDLLRRCAAARRPPRAWSVACSDGAELYSVAMLLAEQGALDGADLLGTDFRAAAIDRARSGVLAPATVWDIPSDLCRRFVCQQVGRFRVSEEIRRAVRWRVENALDPAPPGEPWDLILCRNLAIYLTPEASDGLWRNLVGRLRPGGILVVGKAERTAVPGLERLAPCVYRLAAPSAAPQVARCASTGR